MPSVSETILILLARHQPARRLLDDAGDERPPQGPGRPDPRQPRSGRGPGRGPRDPRHRYRGFFAITTARRSRSPSTTPAPTRSMTSRSSSGSGPPAGPSSSTAAAASATSRPTRPASPRRATRPGSSPPRRRRCRRASRWSGSAAPMSPPTVSERASRDPDLRGLEQTGQEGDDREGDRRQRRRLSPVRPRPSTPGRSGTASSSPPPRNRSETSARARSGRCGFRLIGDPGKAKVHVFASPTIFE